MACSLYLNKTPINMKSYLYSLFIFLSIFSLTNYSYATIVTSNGTGGGDWDDKTTWNPETVPGCVDTISILAGDVVEITANQDYEACPAMVILIYGTLHFPNNGPKFKLPCNSRIDGFAGGLISAPGHDNSNKISICGAWVFESNDPDLSGPFTLGTSTLPIELIGFDAKIDNTAVMLTWSTAVEINNDYFNIERSTNGLSFETIGTISGNGNSNIIQDYSYLDETPIKGTSYYRLKQTDYDGKFEYFKLITVNYSEEEDGTCVLNVYPNPCTGNCTINLADCPLAENEVDVQLYDAVGNQITNRIQPKSGGRDVSFHMNTNNNLSPGVYIVRSKTGSKQQTQKVIVK